MTALRRALEMVATMRKCQFSITKYSPRLYAIHADNLDFGPPEAPRPPTKAVGSGETLEEAAERFVASALRVGFLEEETPPTEPGPTAVPRRCAKCARPEDAHNVRHPFVAIGSPGGPNAR
jgi:hypothetical protein